MNAMTPKSKPVGGGSLAPLKNVGAAATLMQTLITRGPNRPPIGVFHGPSGFGKTMAATYVQNTTRAARVEIGDSWGRKKLIEMILKECSITPRGSIADMVEVAIEYLGEEERPLIVDEADKAVDKGMIEMIREIADKSRVPVLLIGEERLPQKLAQIERVHNRVLEWLPAEPCDLGDARVLANRFCPVAVDEDLLADILEASAGRPRRVIVNLDRVAEAARNAGLKAMDRGTYAGGYYTGQAPRTRSV